MMKRKPTGKKKARETDFPQTLQEAIKYFSDPETCTTFMAQMRWADGVTCPYCAGKVAVMGLLERDGKVRAKVMFTDGWKGYSGLHTDYIHQVIDHQWRAHGLSHPVELHTDYIHQVIDHAEKYVDGQIHTNSIENFWSLLKRGIRGTYVSVEPFHLFRYLDEQTFRFNERKGNDADRFMQSVKNVAGKQLTYEELTGGKPPSQH